MTSWTLAHWCWFCLLESCHIMILVIVLQLSRACLSQAKHLPTVDPFIILVTLWMGHSVNAPVEKQRPELQCYILELIRPMQGTESQRSSRCWKILGTCSRTILAVGSFLSLLSHIELVSKSNSQNLPMWTAVHLDVPIFTSGNLIFWSGEGPGWHDFSSCSSILFTEWVVYVVCLFPGMPKQILQVL